MKVLRENLICNNELVNLANVFMSISEDLNGYFNHHCEMEWDYFANEHGIELDPMEWSTDWDRGMGLLLRDAVDFLDQEMPEKFKKAVKIKRHPTESPKSGVDYNADYLPVLVTIDPDRLLELWGDREIIDGYGISGFLRLSDDRYWTTTRVLHELIWEELGDYGTEKFSNYYWPDSTDLGECVSHPEIESHYSPKDTNHMCKCEEV